MPATHFNKRNQAQCVALTMRQDGFAYVIDCYGRGWEIPEAKFDADYLPFP